MALSPENFPYCSFCGLFENIKGRDFQNSPLFKLETFSSAVAPLRTEKKQRKMNSRTQSIENFGKANNHLSASGAAVDPGGGSSVRRGGGPLGPIQHGGCGGVRFFRPTMAPGWQLGPPASLILLGYFAVRSAEGFYLRILR
ncbi:hypothetical protein PV328_011885 [Microctonus aethiopoides]|uniref:Uncharacterized protein n=1 Tax=Microctonus aethiopoides TaxID=144406 RepID=A0AA39FH93_9HYME|nr:hypothetical protein PV328_011885 [Microctonus aethiopoides]